MMRQNTCLRDIALVGNIWITLLQYSQRFNPGIPSSHKAPTNTQPEWLICDGDSTNMCKYVSVTICANKCVHSRVGLGEVFNVTILTQDWWIPM